jgi:hypothetical protein
VISLSTRFSFESKNTFPFKLVKFNSSKPTTLKTNIKARYVDGEIVREGVVGESTKPEFSTGVRKDQMWDTHIFKTDEQRSVAEQAISSLLRNQSQTRRTPWITT